MQFHQHQERTVHQKNHQETAGSLGILDEFQQGIARCQRSVEIETVYFLLHFLFFFWINSFLYDIDKDEEGEQPGKDDKLGNPVAQDNLRRVAALLVYHCYLDVSQQTYQYEYTGKIEIISMEILDNLRTHRIHDVAYQGNRGGNGNCLVDEGEVIAAGVLAGSLARLFHAQYIVAALGKTHEEGDEEGHQYNPLTQHDMGSHATCQQAEYETEGYDTDIDDGILLELGAVAEVSHDSSRQHVPMESASMRNISPYACLILTAPDAIGR